MGRPRRRHGRRGVGLAVLRAQYAAASAVCLLLPCSAGAAPPPPEALELAWDAPEGCADQASVAKAIERKIAAVKGRARRTVKLDAKVQRSAGGYVLELQASAGETTMERRIEAASCADLAQATGLIAALLVETAGTTEESEDLSAGSSDLRGLVQAAVWSDVGSLPGPAVGPVVALGLLFSGLRAELSAGYLAPRSIYVTGRADPVGELQVLAFALRACYAVLQVPELGPCVRAEYGSMWGRSQNVVTPDGNSTRWLLVGAGVNLALELTPWLAATAEISAGFPLARPHFDIAGLGPLHEPPAVAGRGLLGLEWRF